MKEKIVIYQVLPRLFGNKNTTRKENGTIEENGCGKLNNFTDDVLARIHDMGFTHIWFTGVIRNATQTNYSSFGIPTQHAEVVKGKAGSPYAITDYYDIDPDLAENVSLRMTEWERLIDRTHRPFCRRSFAIGVSPSLVIYSTHFANSSTVPEPTLPLM